MKTKTGPCIYRTLRIIPISFTEIRLLPLPHLVFPSLGWQHLSCTQGTNGPPILFISCIFAAQALNLSLGSPSIAKDGGLQSPNQKLDFQSVSCVPFFLWIIHSVNKLLLKSCCMPGFVLGYCPMGRTGKQTQTADDRVVGKERRLCPEEPACLHREGDIELCFKE